jgi:hypothetical protein
MGNTGVALARDGSAPFLNPSAIAAIADPRVALSVNLYSFTTTTVDHFHAPRGTDAALARESLSDSRLDPVPSTFCLFVTLGGERDSSAPTNSVSLRQLNEENAERRKLALCAGTTERRELAAAASAAGTSPDGRSALHLSSLARSYGRVHVGPTYGISLSRTIAVGASLHVVDTRVTSVTSANDTSFVAAPGTDGTQSSHSAISSSFSATSFDVAALVGATFRLDSATTLGLAFGPPSVHIGGEIDASDDAEHAGAPEGTLGRTRAATGRFAAPLPMRAAVGLGARTRRMRVEADATYFFPLSDAFRSDLDARTVTMRGDASSDRTGVAVATTDTAGVLDSALGAEVFVSDTLSVLGGVATDFGGVRHLPATSQLGDVVTVREDRAIATLGVGLYGLDGSELLVGTQLAMARGEILVAETHALPAELAPATQQTFSAMLVVAGSTNLATLRKTFDHFRRIPVR